MSLERLNVFEVTITEHPYSNSAIKASRGQELPIRREANTSDCFRVDGVKDLLFDDEFRLLFFPTSPPTTKLL